MDQMLSAQGIYSCPMHADVRQGGPGKCTKCGMDLVPEGTRFRLLRHVMSSPKHIAAVVGLTLLLMAAVLMMLSRYAQ